VLFRQARLATPFWLANLIGCTESMMLLMIAARGLVATPQCWASALIFVGSVLTGYTMIAIAGYA